MATELLKTWIGDFVKFQIEGYLLDPPPRQQNKEVLAKLGKLMAFKNLWVSTVLYH
jgi:hypothetical protein